MVRRSSEGTAGVRNASEGITGTSAAHVGGADTGLRVSAASDEHKDSSSRPPRPTKVRGFNPIPACLVGFISGRTVYRVDRLIQNKESPS
jgi:hypothetical protein